MALTLQGILAEIKARKIRRALAVYVGIALPAVGLAALPENRYAIALVLDIQGMVYAALNPNYALAVPIVPSARRSCGFGGPSMRGGGTVDGR